MERDYPGLHKHVPDVLPAETYKTIGYARRETTLLARQLRWLIPRDSASRTELLALPQAG